MWIYYGNITALLLLIIISSSTETLGFPGGPEEGIWVLVLEAKEWTSWTCKYSQ